MPRTLAQNAQYIAETIKPAIKSAIEAQGVTVPSTDSFLDYADRIAEIEGGGSGYQLKDLPTGSIATVNDAAELPLNALKVSVEAQQDLHGYDHPWGGGAGKNKLPLTVDGIKSANSGATWTGNSTVITGVTFTILTDNDGNVTGVNINGTASSDISFILNNLSSLTSGVNYIITTGCATASTSTYFMNVLGVESFANAYTFTYDGTPRTTRIYIRNGTTTSNAVFKPMVRLATESDDTFTPYSNICPIIGWDSGEITVCDDIQSPTQTETTSLDFPQTIYGAEWDVVNGGMKKKERGFQISQTAWSHNTTYGYHLFLSNTLLNKALNYNYICECYKTKIGARDQLQDGEIGTYNTQSARNIFAIRDDRFDNVTDFVNAMGNYKIKYELTESSQETIDFSPLSIRMLQGVNNIYADCGEVIEGEYFVDEGAHRYQLYDYIESDGTQVIDLGFAPENGATVTTSFVLLSTQTSEAFAYGATDNSAWLGFAQNPANRNTIYENNTSGRSESYIQNQQYLLTLTASRDYTNHLCMFGFYLNGYAPGIKTRLCYCKYNDNFYLPAKRKSDGVFGLYDVTNQTFLTDSAGGNAFVGGNPIGVGV